MNQLLLIEDNQPDARLVAEYLSETFTNGDRPDVLWKSTLDSGLAHLGSDGADCVLVDLGLPDARGLEAVERVVEASGETPVIVLTGLDDEEAAVRALQTGADDYLRKGELTPTSLRRAVRYAGERRRLQRAVREQADRLEEAFEQAPAAIASTRGPQHVFEMVNPACRRLLGDREVVERPAREVLPELDGSGYFEALDRAYESGETVTGRERPLALGSAGGRPSPRYVNFALQPRRESGEVVGVLAHLIDVTEEISARREVDQHRERLGRILNTVSEGVLVVGPDLEFQFANPAAERILGVGRTEIRRWSYDDEDWVIRTRDDAGIPDGLRPVEHVLRSGRAVEDVEIDVTRPDGQELVLSVNASPLQATDGPAGVVVSIRDVTERKGFEEQLRHRALHDTLTGLPNRALFRDRLEHVLESMRRTRDTAAVLFLDIDRFKIVNDSLGHEAGDRVLEEVARRLQESVRDADTVARMGGDEFTILLETLEDGAVAETVAERIIDALEAPVSLGEKELHVEVSIGIAVHDRVPAEDELSEADSLIARADQAMFRAKETPGTAYRFASSGGCPGVGSQLELEMRLRDALEAGEIETAYQPIFDLETGALSGVEALARWEDAELGRISPGRFIPLAEETGLIGELGRQQMLRACRRVRSWNERSAGSPLRLHVNLSMGQLDDPNVVRQIRGVLDETRLPVEQLWLEITESVTMRQPDRLRELSELGARLVVDDFGTRYSTLAQLKRLDLSALKIDRTFVDGMVEDSRDRAIVGSVVTLGQNLGLEVVAEGIETEQQLRALEDLDCDLGQGFFLGRPMPASGVSRVVGDVGD